MNKMEKTFDGFIATSETLKSNVAKVKAFETNDKKILILTGSPGTGKTHLLRALMKTIVDKKWSEIEKELDRHDWDREKQFVLKKNIFVSADVLYYAYYNWLFPKLGNEKGKKCSIENVLSSQHLYIDDLGSERMNDNFLECLKDILDNNPGKIAISTNLDRPELEQRYGIKIYSRLCENRDVVTFKQQDYRRKDEGGEL